MSFTIVVNGKARIIGLDGDTPLLWVLRDVLGSTGTKCRCGLALSGACTVHVDGVAIRSCVTPVDSIGVSGVTTIEAICATPASARIPIACWKPRSCNADAVGLATPHPSTFAIRAPR